MCDGQTVLIPAGAGDVGGVAIPMAKYLGAIVYTTARKKNFEYVSSVGADCVIDHSAADYATEISVREGCDPQSVRGHTEFYAYLLKFIIFLPTQKSPLVLKYTQRINHTTELENTYDMLYHFNL